MSVMNIKHLFLAAASLGVFAACSDYDPGMSENVVDYTDEELELIQEYTANFVERYGDIDPNHTWGFGELGNKGEAMDTRTVVQVNRNQWITLNKDNQENRNLTSITTENIGGVNVPGFPSSVDDLYHIWTDGAGSGDYTTAHKAIDLDELKRMVKEDKVDEVLPAGDVTDEEILYVSTWFRTHQNPTPDPFSADKFFVQTISKDYDRVNYQDVTQAEKDGTAPAWYNTTTYGYLKNIPIKYFVNGEEVQYDYNGNQRDPNLTVGSIDYSLDYLAVQKAPGEAYEPINNFNSANTPKISESNPVGSNDDYSSAVGKGIEGTSHRMMEYVIETGTNDFQVHSSNIDVLENKWVLKHLTFTGRDGKNYDGWYLAFDIAYKKAEQTENTDEGTWQKMACRDYDGYYSNYIVKIIPGEGNIYDFETLTEQVSRPKTVSARVMCEDLGTTNDFDFNDVVFDVTYTGNGNCTETTVIKKKKGTGEVVSTETTYSDWTVDANGWTGQITLLASGGTLPIYVQNFNGQQFECHETLLGADNPNLKVGEKYNPINVGANVDGIESVTLQSVSGLTSTNPDNINIYVHAPSSEDRAASAQTTIVLPRAQGGQYEDVSAAPQKICVPSGTKWMKESQQIEWTHTYFRNWVNKRISEYNFGGTMDWTTQGLVKTNLLY